MRLETATLFCGSVTSCCRYEKSYCYSGRTGRGLSGGCSAARIGYGWIGALRLYKRPPDAGFPDEVQGWRDPDPNPNPNPKGLKLRPALRPVRVRVGEEER